MNRAPSAGRLSTSMHPPHRIHDLPADGQPEPGAQADGAALRALRIGLEQLRVIGR